MSKNDFGNMKIHTILGEEGVFEGDLKVKGNVRIEGTIKGIVESEEAVVIGPSGVVEGDIKARHVLVGGTLNGNIEATGRVEIVHTANVKGDIKSKSLLIDEKGKFDGRCIMNLDAAEK